MPTITTTVTSAAASGVVTTQTITEATPEAAGSGTNASKVEELLATWAAGTLTTPANLDKFYDANVQVDYGTSLGIKGTDLFSKYSGHAGIKAWLDLLDQEMDFSQADFSCSEAKDGSVLTQMAWAATVTPTGNPIAGSDIIRMELSAGKVSNVSFFFQRPMEIVDAYVQPAAKAALATDGYMLSEPEVPKEDLKGQVALVTGASRGIGKYSAIHLAVNCGMKVVLAARSTAKLAETVAEIKAAGGEAMAITLDISKEDQFGPALDKIEKAYGPVRYCFANAGVANNFSTAPHDITKADMEYVWGINQMGALCTFTAVHKHFKKNGGGVFVMTSSSGGSLPGCAFEQIAGGALYCASKAAVNDLCKSLGAGYFKDNIRVYNVCPFAYSTDMLDHIAHDISGGTISGDDISVVNPFFPGKAGPPAAIGPLVEAFFDGDTLYRHGSCVECDHHVTFNSQLKYNRWGHKINEDAGQHLSGISHLPEEIRDMRGRPLSKEALAKIPGLGVTKKFDLGLK